MREREREREMGESEREKEGESEKGREREREGERAENSDNAKISQHAFFSRMTQVTQKYGHKSGERDATCVPAARSQHSHSHGSSTIGQLQLGN